MDSDNVVQVVRDLSDIELAALVCLVAEQHCIIRTADDVLDDLADEIAVSSQKIFGLSCVVIDLNPWSSSSVFDQAVLDVDGDGADTTAFPEMSTKQSTGQSHGSEADVPQPMNTKKSVANVVVAKYLDRASRDVQIQALELMRSKMISGTTRVHEAPLQFLFVALLSDTTRGPPYLTPHLNDSFFIAHYHYPEDSLPNLEALDRNDTTSVSDAASVVRLPRRNFASFNHSQRPIISHAMLKGLRKSAGLVRATSEMRRYIHNIPTFMRLNRAVGGGISALSSRHLTLLSRILPPLHGLSYVTPSFVALAARKVFPHRIEITTAENERSMQWGSDLDAVMDSLKEMDPDTVIEQVLAEVDIPL